MLNRDKFYGHFECVDGKYNRYTLNKTEQKSIYQQLDEDIENQNPILNINGIDKRKYSQIDFYGDY